MISTNFFKSSISKMLDCVKALAMTFIFVSGVLAEPPEDQTEALYFNVNDGKMYLWNGIGILPGAVTTEATADNYSGSYTWDGLSTTLTLENFEYSTSMFYALYFDAPVTLELVGNNTLTSTFDGDRISAGLYFLYQSTIKGTGTLTTRAGTVDGNRSAGIYSDSYGLTIEGGKIHAFGGAGLMSNGIFVLDVLTINGGAINAHGGESNGDGEGESTGISAEQGLVMNGGKVYADCMDANEYSSGVWSSEGSIEIHDGVFISKGYKGAVFANTNVDPPGSDIIFPEEGYVVWYNEDIDYVPEGGGIFSEDYLTAYSSDHKYVKFVNFSVDDIAAPTWIEGEVISLTPPTVFSGGKSEMNPGWEISEDGVNDWEEWTVPNTASIDLHGMYIRYTTTIEDIGVVYSNVVKITIIPTYLFTVSAGEGGMVSGTTSGRYREGTTISVEAAADVGYHFTDWTVTDATIDDGNTANPATFEMPANTVTLTANFTLNTYDVIYDASENGTLSVTANGNPVESGASVVYGTVLTIMATPDHYYHLETLTVNGDPFTSGEEYIVTSTTAISAAFVVNTGGSTEISDMTVDGVSATRTGSHFSVSATCGSDLVTVYVANVDPDAMVEIDGEEQNPLDIQLSAYGDHPVTIQVTASSGDVQQYTLTINKPIPFEQLVVMRWNNTLSVINNPASNGGYNFTSYRWFRDGQEFWTGQWYSAGANGETLNTNYEYQVEVTTANGKVFRTCPNRVTLKSMEVKAYPNPVANGQTLYIEADVDEELLKGAVIEVYDLSGNRIDYMKAQGRLTPVNRPYTTGVYIFVLKGNDGFTKDLRVAVR